MAEHNIFEIESDYGSDFSPEDERLLIQLVSATSQTSGALAASPGQTDALHYYEGPNQGDLDGLRVSQTDKKDLSNCFSQFFVPASLDAQVAYPDLSRALSEINGCRGDDNTVADAQDVDPDSSDDERSPLQRFRSFPRRPLTVTDLTAGAWCELQYWYTLTRLPGGRRTKTAAMKGGLKIHRQLEDEVHTTVQVDVLTKEDGFALKLWNFIHGLRTLRNTGLTRELEVWGVVDDNFVNGVIDAVSHQNPNPDFEKELVEQAQHDSRQRSLLDFFTPGTKSSQIKTSPKIYLADVKTRGSLLPISKPLLRPAKIQLMLYHRFLAQIAAGRLDFAKLFRRYGLDADDTLSDGFIAQMGDIYDEVFHDSRSYASSFSDDGSIGTDLDDTTNSGLLRYQTLRELSHLVQDEVKLTFPEGEASMGQMLRVQYVHRDDGREIDMHDFPVCSPVLDEYLARYMRWWRGERKAVGVDIEDAFKCRTCEFADECSWRNAMVEEHVRKARATAATRRKVREPSVSS